MSYLYKITSVDEYAWAGEPHVKIKAKHEDSGHYVYPSTEASNLGKIDNIEKLKEKANKYDYLVVESGDTEKQVVAFANKVRG